MLYNNPNKLNKRIQSALHDFEYEQNQIAVIIIHMCIRPHNICRCW